MDVPLTTTGRMLLTFCPSLNMALPSWDAAMHGCFHFEVMVRLTAQKHFAGESITKEIADQQKGNKTEEGLLSMLFRTLDFAAAEQTFLRRCNGVRNKLIHCEQDALLRLLQEIDPNFRPSGVVTQVALSGDDVKGALFAALETGKGATAVQATVTRVQGFLGWMLEAAGNGTFHRAEQVFVEAVKILYSKADQEPKGSNSGSG